MARKKYRKGVSDQDDIQDQDPIHEEQEDQKKQLDINTILLGIILLFLVVQTYMMVTADTGSPAANTGQQYDGNTNAPAPQSPQAPTTGQPQTPFNPADGQPQASSGNAVAVYSENEIDLGTVAAGQKVKHTFNVQNTGSDDLVFGDVSTDPGLLVVDGPQTTIPPGGSGSITVELNTDGLSGPVNKIVHVNSNSEPAHFHLQVNATVQ